MPEGVDGWLAAIVLYLGTAGCVLFGTAAIYLILIEG